jgi:hypothetical protein
VLLHDFSVLFTTLLSISPIISFSIINSYDSQRRASSLAVSALVDLERDVALRVRNAHQSFDRMSARTDDDTPAEDNDRIEIQIPAVSAPHPPLERIARTYSLSHTTPLSSHILLNFC